MANTMGRAAAAAGAAIVLANGAVPAGASEIQDAYYKHTRECIRLFMTDEAAHAAQCLPNNSANLPAHGGSGGAPAPIVVPPPVVVAPPPPPPPVVVAPPPPPPVIVPAPVGSGAPA